MQLNQQASGNAPLLITGSARLPTGTVTLVSVGALEGSVG